MRRLITAFIDSAFGRAPDGRDLFMPFGAYGKSYVIRSVAEIVRLRRGVAMFLPFVAIIPAMLVALLVTPAPVRNGAAPWLLPATMAAIGLFAIAFLAWTRAVAAGLVRLEAGVPAILALMDMEDAAGKAIIAHLEHVPEAREGSEALLAVFGALAGFACQMAVRAQASLEGRPAGLIEVTTNDGRLFYFGDALNSPLAESPTSVWAIVSERAPMDELDGIFRDVAATIGTDAFGADPFATSSAAKREPIEVLKRDWPSVIAILVNYRLAPPSWPVALALAGKRIGRQAQLGASDAALIMMRMAVPMSKIDPAEVLTRVHYAHAAH